MRFLAVPSNYAFGFSKRILPPPLPLSPISGGESSFRRRRRGRRHPIMTPLTHVRISFEKPPHTKTRRFKIEFGLGCFIFRAWVHSERQRNASPFPLVSPPPVRVVAVGSCSRKARPPPQREAHPHSALSVRLKRGPKATKTSSSSPPTSMV